MCVKKYAKIFCLPFTYNQNKKNPLKNEIKGGCDEFHHQKDYHHKE